MSFFNILRENIYSACFAAFGFLLGFTTLFFIFYSKHRKTEKKIKEIKNILETRVKEKTKQLEELARVLEDEVEERTKELQERVGELEKFHSLVVGREEKMIELKEKIKKMESELKKVKTL